MAKAMGIPNYQGKGVENEFLFKKQSYTDAAPLKAPTLADLKIPTTLDLNKDQIKTIAIQKRDEGLFYDNKLPYLERNFLGSIDRFCEIAYELRFSKRILDAGSGYGLLPALLSILGHEIYAVDLIDHSSEDIYLRHKILFNICNIEVDTLPFETGFFDAITCCQALEHFTHSHLGPLIEMRRVLKEGGLIEIDVPNVVSFRNRSRILRGKNITYDYKKHYLYEKENIRLHR
jgi:SAM-dependent methyltransferase